MAGARRGAPERRGIAKPALHVLPTTLWEYPSQHYGERIQGDQQYAGATPSWVVWQCLMRYTREGDTVLDPMCGSGTTLDVCADLKRKGIGFDLAPSRPDIRRADARALPLKDASVDFVFVDPPYSTHVDYSDDPACIGKLDAAEPDGEGGFGGAYYGALGQAIAETHRALRERRFMALYVSDSYKKRGAGSDRPSFVPIGFEVFSILRGFFTPADIVCVARGNEKLGRGNWRKAAVEGNYFLRGFNYLFIMKKEGAKRGAP